MLDRCRTVVKLCGRILCRRGVLAVCGAALGLLLVCYSNLWSVIRYELTGSGTMPLTLHCNEGRLGNQLCTFATLLGLSVLNGRTWAIHHCNWRHLNAHFPHLGSQQLLLPWLFVPKGGYKIGSYLRPSDRAIPQSVNYVDGYKYPCSYTFFDHVREDLRRRLTFNPEVQRRADAILRRAAGAIHAIPTYVGVHVRRGDYQRRWLDAFEGVAVDMRYFRLALTYFRNRHRAPIVFVAVSDDRAWCQEHLAPLGVHVAENGDAVEDLALLAACNHTVMTYGTFGFWGAYLAGGETVYFDNFLKPDTEFARERFLFSKMYPPSWIGIAADNGSFPWLRKDNETAVT